MPSFIYTTSETFAASRNRMRLAFVFSLDSRRRSGFPVSSRRMGSLAAGSAELRLSASTVLLAQSVSTTEYALPTAYVHPEDIVARPDGALWFVEEAGSKIGRRCRHTLRIFSI